MPGGGCVHCVVTNNEMSDVVFVGTNVCVRKHFEVVCRICRFMR